MQQATLNPKKIRFRKERSFSRKLDVTFAFVGEQAKPIGRNILLIAGPFALLTGICYSLYQNYALGTAMGGNVGGGDGLANLGSFGAGALGMIFFSFITTALVVAITMRHIRLYIAEGHCQISTASLWKSIWKDFFNVLGTTIMIFICILLLMFILSLPLGLVSLGQPNPVLIGLMFMVVMVSFLLILPGFLLLYPIRSIERVGIFTAIDRMFRLISGKWLSTAGLTIVTFIIQLVISIVFAIPMYIFMYLRLMHTQEESVAFVANGTLGNIIFALTSGFSMLGSFTLYALLLIAISFQYFSLVERREATGLLERINSFGEKKADTEDDAEHY